MKKTAKIILTTIISIILALIVGASIYSNVQKVKGNTLPMPFGMGVAVTETGSMEPNMPQGSLVFLIKDKSYEIGDIVAFRKDGDTIYTVHRIVKIDDDTVTTCGDANNGSNDDPIQMDEIKGRVLFNIPKLGFILQDVGNFLSHPITLIVIFAAAAVGLFFAFKPNKDVTTDQSVDEIKAEIERLKQDSDDNNVEDDR